MLNEFSNIGQEKEGYRRIFLDEDFELYIWYNQEGGDIVGFQLCYNLRNDEHSLTWIKGKGYSHSKIDDGENRPGRMKQSPILLEDGVFNKKQIARDFKRSSKSIDVEIAEYIYSKILEFSSKKINSVL